MRRLFLVCLTVFLSAGLALSVTFSVNAQTASQYGSSEGEAAPKTSVPPDTREVAALGMVPQAQAELSAEAARVSVEKDPYYQIVDNATPGRFRAPGYERGSADGQTFGGDYAFARAEEAGVARYKVKVPETRYYSVYARWPASATNTTAARFGVPTPRGTKWDEVDQRLDGGGSWVRIGGFKMQKGERVVQVKAGPDSKGRVVADAVMVVGDAMVGPGGQTASFVDPSELADGPSVAGGEATKSTEPAFSTRSISNPTAADVVRAGRRHKGTPYRYGDLSVCRSLRTEDCSCFTRLVFQNFGYTLPDHPGQQWSMRAGTKFFSKSQLRPGDLVFHDYSRDGDVNDAHDGVAIYSGNGNVLHASSFFGEVVESKESYLPFYGAKRLALR